jgi:hypothetical protein
MVGKYAARCDLGVLEAAKLLVLPSQCYETFARVAIEAFAKGRKWEVISSTDISLGYPEDAKMLSRLLAHKQLNSILSQQFHRT